MAKLSQLVPAVTAALGVDEGSARSITNELRKAGLIRTAGRGTNAAEMGPHDAAVLLVGLSHISPLLGVARSTGLILNARPEEDSATGEMFGQALSELIDEQMKGAASRFKIKIESSSAAYLCTIERGTGEPQQVSHYVAPRRALTGRDIDREWYTERLGERGVSVEGTAIRARADKRQRELEARQRAIFEEARQLALSPSGQIVTFTFDDAVVRQVAECLRDAPTTSRREN
jgi:hypothetical protein